MPVYLGRRVFLTILATLFLSRAIYAQNRAPSVLPSLLLLMDEAQSIPIPVDKPIEGLKTSVAAFVGVTESGSIYLNRPTKVTSWLDFLTKFGGYTSSAPYMAPAVASFFQNGGAEVYIVKTPNDSDSAIIGSNNAYGGLSSLSSIDEVSIVLAPGLTSPAVTRALITHSETMGDRIAIIDAPEDGNSVAFLSDPITGYVNSLASRKGHAAVYTPWYLAPVIDRNGVSQPIYIPPSGGVAGVYARVDRKRGVHKSPANEPLLDALSLKVDYSSAQIDLLNPFNINPLRADLGNGVLIWGARTTSTNPEWKYISVRRLLMHIKESIEEGTQWVVAEQNNPVLWGRVRSRIEDFLNQQWRSGALMGAKPEDAYFARCDSETMTRADIEAGRLICLMGVAPVQPAEFLVFELNQNTR